MTINNREAGYALLRATIGMIFLTTGIIKIASGLDVFAANLHQTFAGKLPALVVTPFAYVLPFAEVIAGGMLVLGLFSVPMLILAGLLIIVLTFGMTVAHETVTIAGNLVYALIIFVLLWLTDHNGFSLDRLRRGRSFHRK